MGFKNKKYGLREEILIAFIVCTIITLGTVTLITGIFAGVISGTTSTQTTNALRTQVQQDMLNKVGSNALIIDNELQHVGNDLNGFAESVANVFQGPLEFENRKSYYHTEYLPNGTRALNGTILSHDVFYPENIPTDVYYDRKLELNVSDCYSGYMIYNTTYNAMGNNEKNLTGIHGLYINRSAALDPIMRGIVRNNSAYAWMYIEFAIGIQRTFPWTGVDLNVYGNATEPAFDYKTEDWYIDAVAANGALVWSVPYADPYLGWMITCSRAIYNGSISKQNFLGVVGIDMTLDTITEIVKDIQLYKTGYGFLTDAEGSVIAHPNVEFDPNAEKTTSITEVEPISNPILTNMTQMKTSFNEITKSGKKYYLSYTPIKTASYVLGAIVLQDEVLEPVKNLQAKINLQTGIQIGIMILVLIGIVVLVLFVGLRVADSVVRPIQKLTEIAIKLSTEDVKRTSIEIDIDTDFNIKEAQETDEIGDLMNAFKNLVKKVKEENQPNSSNPNPQKDK